MVEKNIDLGIGSLVTGFPWPGHEEGRVNNGWAWPGKEILLPRVHHLQPTHHHQTGFLGIVWWSGIWLCGGDSQGVSWKLGKEMRMHDGYFPASTAHVRIQDSITHCDIVTDRILG